MRVLTDEETKVFFKKLSEYMGENIKFLIDRSDEPYVFRLIKDRIYYMSESLMKLASNVARDNLVQCFYYIGLGLASENSQKLESADCISLAWITWRSTPNTRFG